MELNQVRRPIEGATVADKVVVSNENDNALGEYLNIPQCPASQRAFIEETALETLVYWKLESLLEKFDESLPPDNVMKVVLDHVERPLFALILKKTNGNQSKAAEVLGCNRNTLHRKLKGFSLEPMDLRRQIKSLRTKPTMEHRHTTLPS